MDRNDQQEDGTPIAFVGPNRTKEIAGFSLRTIDRKIAKGEFPAPAIAEGNVRRWDLAQVLEWRKAQLAKQPQIAAKIRAQAEARASKHGTTEAQAA